MEPGIKGWELEARAWSIATVPDVEMFQEKHTRSEDKRLSLALGVQTSAGAGLGGRRFQREAPVWAGECNRSFGGERMAPRA